MATDTTSGWLGSEGAGAERLEELTAKGKALNEMFEQQQRQVELTRTVIETLQRAQARYGEQVEDCRARLAAAGSELENMENSAEGAAEEQGRLQGRIADLNRELEQAEDRERQAALAMDDWVRANSDAQQGISDLSGEIEENRRLLLELRSSAEQGSGSLDELGGQLRDTAGDSEDFGSGMGEAIGSLSEALEASGVDAALEKIQEVLTASLESAKQFESGMTEVYTLLPGRSKDTYEKMREDVLQFSSDMNVLTEDVVPALYTALSDGVDEENVFDFLTTAQQAAVGGATDLETAMESLSTVVNAYGESVLTAEEAADMMFAAIELGGSNFDQLAESVGSVVPSAAEAGVGFENVAAALAVMTAQGASGGAAASQLSQMLGELSDRGSEVGNTFRDVTGKSFQEFIAGGGGVQKALQVLEEHAAQTGTSIDGLFSIAESGEAALALTGDSAASFSEALAGMENSAGAAGAAYRAMTDTAEFASQGLQVSMENVKIAIGDALLPAFQSLAGAASSSLDWAAQFIEENPWIVAAVAGLAAGIAVLSAGLAAFTIVTEGASLVMAAFSAAMATNPIGLAAIAIGSVVAAIATFNVIAGGAASEAQKLTKSIKESKEAYEESREAMEAQNDDLMATVAALETLSEKEHKSAAEKETLLSLVNELNEAMPNLNLAYDEQTDSLNLTAEAIKNLAIEEAKRAEQEALQERLKELYVESAVIENDLADATRNLAAAEAEKGEQTERSGSARGTSLSQAREMASIYGEERRSVLELTNAQKNNQEEIEKLQVEYDGLSHSLNQAGTAGDGTRKKGRELAKTTSDLEAETKNLIAGEDQLSRAFQEQSKNGELSLDTILSLIESGHTNMLTVDSETGAVKLNSAAYIESRTQKINDQIASLEAQKTSNDTRLKIIDETAAVMGLTGQYMFASVARKGIESEQISLSAQINALEEVKSKLNSYSGAATGAASSARHSSETVKTQAEKDLEEFRKLKAALDHEKAMGLKTEEEYYRRLKEYRDQYLTSEDNIDTYRSITESIYEYDQKLQEEQLENYETHLQNMVDAAGKELEGIQKQYDDVLSQQEDLRKKLSEYGELFKVDSEDKMSLTDLDEQYKTLQQYEATLNELRTKGISDGLMNEVLAMDVDDAIEYGGKLTGMDEEDLQEYSDKWDAKQKLAKEISERFYSDELETLETDYNDKLDEAMGTLKDTAFDSGVEAGAGLLSGLDSKKDELYRKAREIADRIAKTLSEAFKTGLGDDNKKRKDGSHGGGLNYVPFDGYMAELHRGERVLTASETHAYVAAAKPSANDISTVGQIADRQNEAMVNALGTLAGGVAAAQADGPATIVLQMGDGTEMARWLLPSIREASDQSPRVEGDRI